jgi:hypothetical protein
MAIRKVEREPGCFGNQTCPGSHAISTLEPAIALLTIVWADRHASAGLSNAQGYLETPIPGSQTSRGDQMLGYCYVWLDQLEDAAELLADIPEAEYEMSVYSWW